MSLCIVKEWLPIILLYISIHYYSCILVCVGIHMHAYYTNTGQSPRWTNAEVMCTCHGTSKKWQQDKKTKFASHKHLYTSFYSCIHTNGCHALKDNKEKGKTNTQEDEKREKEKIKCIKKWGAYKIVVVVAAVVGMLIIKDDTSCAIRFELISSK